MRNTKTSKHVFVISFAAISFFLSFVVGLFSSVSFFILLFRAAIVAIIFACLSFVFRLLIDRYLPGLLVGEENARDKTHFEAVVGDDTEKINKDVFSGFQETNTDPTESRGAPTESGDTSTETGDAPTETGDAPTETGDAPTETGNTLNKNLAEETPDYGKQNFTDEDIESISNESPEILARAVQTVLRTSKGDDTA